MEKRTNREMLIAALQAGPENEEAKKIIARHIECWCYPEAFCDLMTEAMCRGMSLEDVDEEVCTACKIRWLDRVVSV